MTEGAPNTIRCILVPLDGSDFSESALPYALTLARAAGAQIRLLHVHEPLPGAVIPGQMPGAAPSPETSDEDATAWAWQYLEVWAERVRAEAAVDAFPDVVTGTVVSSVAHASQAGHADLVVMTTHGRGGLARAWLGSTADAVVRVVGVPVLLVRPTSEATDIRQQPRVEHILLPLDGSPLAESILPHVASFAGIARARVTLITVVLTTHAGSVQPELSSSPASAYLNRMASTSAWAGVSVETRVVGAARAEAGILRALGQQPGELIAMATHGRGGISRFLLGSVADKVLRSAAVPVLLYSPR